MVSQDAVEYSNQCIETMNRLPHPQEIWDAALASVEENASSTHTDNMKIILHLEKIVKDLDYYLFMGGLNCVQSKILDYVAQLRKAKIMPCDHVWGYFHAANELRCIKCDAVQ